MWNSYWILLLILLSIIVCNLIQFLLFYWALAYSCIYIVGDSATPIPGKDITNATSRVNKSINIIYYALLNNGL